jgi:drug/metabolite transporter (DMT)-like permease
MILVVTTFARPIDRRHVMVILLGLAAAVLYGCGDFIGGTASRKVSVLTVLMLAESAGSVVALAAAALSPGAASLAGLAWGAGAGMAGGLGLILFYTGLAAGPMSVVAPVSGLVSTILPVAVALAEGERPGLGVYAGALLCFVAIVLASSAWPSCSPRCTQGSPCCWPGWCSANGCAGCSRSAWGSRRSASCSSRHEAPGTDGAVNGIL